MDRSASLLHPTVLTFPDRLTDVDAWHAHIPVAFLLVHLLRPRVFVELGTHRGDSYCAFCQEVKALGLDTRCYAVDTWTGDVHSGRYDEAALDELRRYHDPRYGSFSTLLQMTFDEARRRFANGEVDLLHIDGEHTFAAVSHDFESWLPKLSRRGVVVFHDTTERHEDFGVWRLWDLLSSRYPSFELKYGHGLGVAAVGPEPEATFLDLVEVLNEETSEVLGLLSALGDRVVARSQASRLAAELEAARGQAAALDSELEAARGQAAALDSELEAARGQAAALDSELNAARGQAAALDSELLGMRRSKSWRLTLPLRMGDALARRLGRTAHGMLMRLRGTWQMNGSPVSGVERTRRIVSRAGRPLETRPLVSIIMPTWNTDPMLLASAISSVSRQTYPNWELCICDDGSTRSATRETIREFAAGDGRIKAVFSGANHGISAASNKALNLAAGEFVAFLDHDDELETDSLYELVGLLNEKPTTDVIYTDEDKIDSRGIRSEPFFKPDWSPEYFRGVMYVGHLLLIRRTLVEAVGGFDSTYDGVQDYELMLRVSERTDRIQHLPLLLYHWRKIPGSVAAAPDAKANIGTLQAKAVQAQLDRESIPAVAVEHPSLDHRTILDPAPRKRWPLVSIVIPTRDAPEHIGRCLDSIFARTRYEPFEVVVVDNQTTDADALAILDQHPVRRVRFDERFNFSRANNLGVEAANGTHVVLLNNDTEVIDPAWLTTLVWHAELPGVGAVGPLLVYPDRTVQHAGVVLGLRGTADHVLRGEPAWVDGYAGSLVCTREVSAVTGACLITPRSVYSALGGLNDYYATHYQDVDFCLRLRRDGYHVLFTPRTSLIHYESASRGSQYDRLDRALLLDCWREAIEEGDPYYNPNFSLEKGFYRCDASLLT